MYKTLKYVQRGLILGILVISAAILITSCVVQDTLAKDRIVLKDGDLYSISETLGEKRITTDKKAKILFDKKDYVILYGKNWTSTQPAESEAISGTELWYMDTETGKNELVAKDVSMSLLGDGGFAFFTDMNQTLFKQKLGEKKAEKIKEKVHTPKISKDNSKIVYQKLPTTWTTSPYFDDAIGLAILDLKNGKETQITKSANDWGAIFTPDSSHVIFSSSNEWGIQSLFSIKIDGSDKTELTNVKSKTIDTSFVPTFSEAPIFSSDGKYMVYESDREIWMIKFSTDYSSILEAKKLAYGINPEWNELFQTVDIVSVPKQGESTRGIIHVNLQGELVK